MPSTSASRARRAAVGGDRSLAAQSGPIQAERRSLGAHMDIALTNVHLDLGAGRRGTDMGPSALHVAGLVPALRQLGHTVEGIVSIGSPSFEAR